MYEYFYFGQSDVQMNKEAFMTFECF